MSPASEPGRNRPARSGSFVSATAAAALLALFTPHAATAGKAHEHGVARLNLIQDGAQFTLELDMPLDTLVGFERAPRTAAERQAAQAALARLREPAGLFRWWPSPRDGAAPACSAVSVKVQAPVLEGQGGPVSAHADAQVLYLVECPDSALPQRLEVSLFAAFPRLKRLEVQAVLPAAQRQFKLTPAQRSVELRR